MSKTISLIAGLAMTAAALFHSDNARAQSLSIDDIFSETNANACLAKLNTPGSWHLDGMGNEEAYVGELSCVHQKSDDSCYISYGDSYNRHSLSMGVNKISLEFTNAAGGFFALEANRKGEIKQLDYISSRPPEGDIFLDGEKTIDVDALTITPEDRSYIQRWIKFGRERGCAATLS